MKIPGFWTELRRAFTSHPLHVVVLWLLISAMSLGDTMEVIPLFSPLLANPVLIYFHHFHYLFAIALGGYASYRYSYTVGIVGALGFLLSHAYYFYHKGPAGLSESLQAFIAAGVIVFASYFIKEFQGIRRSLEDTLAKVQDGLKRVQARFAVSLAEAQAQTHAELFHKAAASILDITRMGLISLHGYHAETGQFLLLAQEGWPPEQARRMSLFKESGAIKEAVYSKQLKIIEQSASEPTPLYSLGEEVGARVMVLVPVVAGEKVLGVLALAGKGKEELSKENLIWLTALGHDIGIAMDRLLILERLEQQRASAQGLARRLEMDKIELINGARQAAHLASMSVESRHPFLASHHSSVADLSLRLARHLGWAEEELTSLELAARVHDLGLLKAPGADIGGLDPLSRERSETIKRHPVTGVEWLKPMGEAFQKSLPAIRSHHEHWDGKGYPDGLPGMAIPASARLMAVVDSYDFLRRNFPQRAALSHNEALDIIRSWSGSALDPQMVEGFLDLNLNSKY